MYIGGVRGEADRAANGDEKIELSLEQRQVAILAAFALILLGVVFALGLMVGRQLASAALAAPVQPAAGDLRALDAEKPTKPEAAPRTEAAPARPAEGTAPVSASASAPAATPASARPQAAPARAPGAPSSASAPAHASPTQPPAPPSPQELIEAADEDDAPAEANTVVIAPAPPKPVTVPAPQKTQAAEGPLPPPPEHLGRFTVQFGATQDRKDAERLEGRARALGMKPYIVVAHLGAKGTWYRLRAGAFETRDEASPVQKDIDRELHVKSAVMPAN